MARPRFLETTMTPKARAWQYCSKYIRLRDAIAYHKDYPEEPFGRVKCCTCERVMWWSGKGLGKGKSQCDAGHFIGRGLGGGSGVYFESTNIHAQCKCCNGWDADMPRNYERFMLEKYGENHVNLLRFMHKNQNYNRKIVMVGLMYKQMFDELKDQLKEQGITI